MLGGRKTAVLDILVIRMVPCNPGELPTSGNAHRMVVLGLIDVPRLRFLVFPAGRKFLSIHKNRFQANIHGFLGESPGSLRSIRAVHLQ